MVISGDVAMNAIKPKASNIIFPFDARQIPITKGRINVAVNGPHTDPPVSNAIAVNIFGEKKVSNIAKAYDTTKNQNIGI